MLILVEFTFELKADSSIKKYIRIKFLRLADRVNNGAGSLFLQESTSFQDKVILIRL